jgi:hypothetical protein
MHEILGSILCSVVNKKKINEILTQEEQRPVKKEL